jgi:hypothetical protein
VAPRLGITVDKGGNFEDEMVAPGVRTNQEDYVRGRGPRSRGRATLRWLTFQSPVTVEAAGAAHQIGDDDWENRAVDPRADAIQQLHADQPKRTISHWVEAATNG